MRGLLTTSSFHPVEDEHCQPRTPVGSRVEGKGCSVHKKMAWCSLLAEQGQPLLLGLSWLPSGAIPPEGGILERKADLILAFASYSSDFCLSNFSCQQLQSSSHPPLPMSLFFFSPEFSVEEEQVPSGMGDAEAAVGRSKAAHNQVWVWGRSEPIPSLTEPLNLWVGNLHTKAWESAVAKYAKRCKEAGSEAGPV